MVLTESEAWAILDLEPGADTTTIRRAYLELVSVWHPDRFQGRPSLETKAQEKLKRINAAYEKLQALPHSRPVAVPAPQASSRPRAARENPAPSAAPSPGDRRRTPRVNLVIPIQFRSTVDSGSRSTRDLGLGGIAIATPHPLKRHQTVPVRFRVPGSTGHTFAEARVAWSIPAIGMGLQFTDLKSPDQAVIAAFVDAHAGSDALFAECSQCGTLLSVAAHHRGAVARCRCGHAFAFP